MTDDSTPPERPEFTALIGDLRALARRQDNVAKAEAARRNAAEIMAKAAQAFVSGRISPADFVRLHAVRLRLDAQLALPGGRG